MTAPKPCPVCGLGVEILGNGQVSCEGGTCGMVGPWRPTEAEAVAAWNRLAALPALVEALEVVWKMLVEHGHTHEFTGDAYPDHALDTFDTGHSSALSDIVRAALALARGER